MLTAGKITRVAPREVRSPISELSAGQESDKSAVVGPAGLAAGEPDVRFPPKTDTRVRVPREASGSRFEFRTALSARRENPRVAAKNRGAAPSPCTETLAERRSSAAVLAYFFPCSTMT